jgi:integrative and conjugative element protein (TIGR02256 family)
MQLLLAPEVMKRLRRELGWAGSREIGGLLLGEHVRDELFRVVEISVQRSGGSHAGFMRRPQRHEKQLRSFYRRTGGDYTRFNYLGEWHSHPCFAPTPSATDLETMQSIVSDSAVGVNFLVLLVCRLGHAETLEATATTFSADAAPVLVPLQLDTDTPAREPGITRRWLRKIFSL